MTMRPSCMAIASLLLLGAMTPVCYGRTLSEPELALKSSGSTEKVWTEMEQAPHFPEQSVVEVVRVLEEDGIAGTSKALASGSQSLKVWKFDPQDSAPQELSLQTPSPQHLSESSALSKVSEQVAPGTADLLLNPATLDNSEITAEMELEIQEYSRWQQAQADPAEDEPVPEVVESDEDDEWRFEFQPTALIPLYVTGTSRIDGLIQLDPGDINIPPGLANLGRFIQASGTDVSLPPDFSLDNFGFQSVETDFELDLGDILEFDRIFRASARAEAWKGDLGIFLEGMYSFLGTTAEVELGPFQFTGPNQGVITTGSQDYDISVESHLGFFDLWRMYSFAFPLGNSSDLDEDGDIDEDDNPGYPILKLEPTAGVHFGFLSQKIDLDPGGIASFSDLYVGPLAGGRISLAFSDTWTIGVRGHVSSFGIADAMEWTLVAGFEWKPVYFASLRLGYRVYDLSYETESDGRDFDYDQTEHGLWTGLTLFLGGR
ncbi:MAG: hypothetical protein ACFBSC_15965 [Microcoleaceae cyanobacterium]